MTVVEKPKTEAQLPLDSLEIRGYRAFKELTIPKLSRVNLITGKNNVGKTSLLEAVYLHSRRGSPAALWDILSMREPGLTAAAIREYPDVWFEIFRLFHGGSPALDFAYAEEIRYSATIRKAPDSCVLSLQIAKPALESDEPRMVHAEFDGRQSVYHVRRMMEPDRSTWEQIGATPCVFVGGRVGLREMWGHLWDSIVLTDTKHDVVAALKLIESQVDDIALFGDAGVGLGRVPNVRIAGDMARHSLGEFGDGMYRLFDIVVAIANVETGILLIDEIENGLHYSVLTDVWKLIFDLAIRLNVQVFATTHSWECIEAFQQALKQVPSEGSLIRLQEKNGRIISTGLDSEDLEVITHSGIEVR